MRLWRGDNSNMRVIQCDKCKKVTDDCTKVISEPFLDEPRFIDLCEECNEKYQKQKKEYFDFLETVKNILNMSLKEKQNELEKKYFGEEKKQDEKESI